MGKLLDALKAQGVEITEEMETIVMADFVEKSEAGLKDTEIAGLKEQLAQRDTDIEILKKDAGKEVQAKLTELQTKYDADTAELKKKVDETKLDGELKVALLAEKARDAELVAGLIDKGKLSVDKDGKLMGLTDQVKAIRESKGFLFEDADSADSSAKSTTAAIVTGYRYVPGAAAGSGDEKVTLKDAVADALQLK